MSHGAVTIIGSADEYRAAIVGAADKPVCIKFTASWCGPCKMIAPVYADLSVRFSNIVCLEVDVDNVPDVAAHEAVRAMPTFIFYRNQQRLATEVRGANAQGLQEALQAVGGQDTGGGAGSGAFAAAGGSGGALAGAPGAAVDGGSAASVAASLYELPDKMQMLDTLVDETQSHCLNQHEEHTIKSVWAAGGEPWLQSDCDAQLLLHVKFKQGVRIHSIALERAAKDEDGDGEPIHAPKKVRLFVDTPALDFSSAESDSPAQELELDAEQTKPGVLVPLRFVRFQKVHSLAIFVESNTSGDEDALTALGRVAFVGQPLAATDMSQFKRVSGKPGEADH